MYNFIVDCGFDKNFDILELMKLKSDNEINLQIADEESEIEQISDKPIKKSTVEKIYTCDLCFYSSDRHSNLMNHYNSKKHILRVQYETLRENKNNTNTKQTKVLQCDNKSEKNPTKKITKHNVKDEIIILPVTQNKDDIHEYTCEICGKSYNYRQNLWTHKHQKHTNKDDDSQITMLMSKIAQLQKKSSK